MREGFMLGMIVVAAAVGVLGCSSQAQPGDEAMAAYLERHGLSPEVAPPTTAARGDAAANDDDAVAPAPMGQPLARRVAITVERATGLPDLDTGPGETDPYVVLEIEGQRQRTSVVEGSLEPVWGDTFVFDVRPGVVLAVKLMDEDALSSDEQLGTVSEVLPEVRVGETKMLTPSFRNGKGGTLTLTLTGMVRP